MQESNIQTNNLPEPEPEPSPGPLCVDINRLHDIEFDEARLTQWVIQILTDHQVTEAEVSIAIVSDEQIHQLNLEYLQHDYETDVLSFNLGSDADAAANGLVGEIIVSADTAIRCAAEEGVDAIDELALYVIHGVLHLVGYDDKIDDRTMEMRAAERSYVERFGLQYSEPRQNADATDGAS